MVLPVCICESSLSRVALFAKVSVDLEDILAIDLFPTFGSQEEEEEEYCVRVGQPELKQGMREAGMKSLHFSLRHI